MVFYDKEFIDKVTQSFGLGPLLPWASITTFFTATFTVICDTITVLGEEIGWRDFLVPEFTKKHGFFATSVITGLVWTAWHYPVILFADYKSDTSVRFYLQIPTLTIPLLNFVWPGMRLKTESIWPGVVLHAAHNTFIQSFFDPLTVHTKQTNYMAREFGTALLVLSFSLAFHFWRRRGEVEGALPGEFQPS